MRELIRRMGWVACPIGRERKACQRQLHLVTQFDDKGRVHHSFFRLEHDDRVYEADSKDGIGEMIDRHFFKTKNKKWHRFLGVTDFNIPNNPLSDQDKKDLESYSIIVADAPTAETFTKPEAVDNRAGTNIRHLDSRFGKYGSRMYKALQPHCMTRYIPDDEENRRALRRIHLGLIRAHTRAKAAVDALVRKQRGQVGPTFTEDGKPVDEIAGNPRPPVPM